MAEVAKENTKPTRAAKGIGKFVTIGRTTMMPMTMIKAERSARERNSSDETKTTRKTCVCVRGYDDEIQKSHTTCHNVIVFNSFFFSVTLVSFFRVCSPLKVKHCAEENIKWKSNVSSAFVAALHALHSWIEHSKSERRRISYRSEAVHFPFYPFHSIFKSATVIGAEPFANRSASHSHSLHIPFCTTSSLALAIVLFFSSQSICPFRPS